MEPVHLDQITTENALAYARRKLAEDARRMLTFAAFGELQTMPLEDARGTLVTFDGAYFEIVGVDDKWDKDNGFSREIRAREKLPEDFI